MPEYSFRSEPLAQHDRTRFACGVPELDAYFRERVTQDRKRSISVAYVLVDNASGDLVGYYTLSSSTVQPARLPAGLARKLPHYDSVGAILIGRLALDQRYQKRGFGRRLLFDALHRCLVLSRQVGIYAVVVDAKDEAAHAFYEHNGFQRLPDDKQRLFIPLAAVAKLLPT